MSDPSPNGGNGEEPQRDSRGRFVSGNRGGPGNPHTQKVNRLRAALLRAVSVRDLRAISRCSTPTHGEWSRDSARRRIERLEAPLGAADRHETMRRDATIAIALMHASVLGRPDDARTHAEKIAERVADDFPDADDLPGEIIGAVVGYWATE